MHNDVHIIHSYMIIKMCFNWLTVSNTEWPILTKLDFGLAISFEKVG